MGTITEDLILDEINRVKAEQEADLHRAGELKWAKINLANLAVAETKPDEFHDSARQNLEQCTDEDKRLAFEALALKVKGLLSW